MLEWVAPIAAKPRFAVAAAKQAIIEGLRLPLADGLRLEGRLFSECQANAAAVELEHAALARYRDTPASEHIEL